MSEDLPSTGWWETAFRWSIKWVVRLLILFLFVIFFAPLFAPLLDIPFQLLFLLLFGWVQYLIEVIPQITFNTEIAFGAAVALALGVYGLHRFFCYWINWQSGPTASWRWSWTWKIAAMTLLLFATSIAATGIVHQIGWLARSSRLVEDKLMSRQFRTLAYMKQAALALSLYAEANEGKTPKTLDELLPTYVNTTNFFW